MSIFDGTFKENNNTSNNSLPISSTNNNLNVENKIDLLGSVSSFPEYTRLNKKDYSPYMENVNYLYSDIDEDRANAQSRAVQGINGLLKGAGLAATTFATTFTSLPYGIGSAIEGSANKLLEGNSKTYSQQGSKVYDNPISNLWDSFNKGMEESFPNYYTKESQEAGAFSPKNWFTMNFFADKLIKNAGFTVGAIGSGSVVAKGLGALGKLAMAGKYEQELNAVTKLAGEFTGQGLSEEVAFTKALNQVGKGIKFTNGVQQLGGVTIAAGNEASMEALQTKQQTFAQLKEKIDKRYRDGEFNEDQYKIELDKADDYASAAGNVDYLANLAILAGSDFIQFKKFFGGFKNERKVLSDYIKQSGGGYAGTMATTLEKTLPYFKGLGTESAEEGSQTFMQSASQDFYSRKYDNDARNKVTDLMSSVGYGLEQTFGTKQGLESMLLGGLTGIISGAATGEIRDNVKELKERDALVKETVENLNKYKVRDIYDKNEEKILNAARFFSLDREYDQRIKEGDKFEALNLKQDMFKSYVLSRIRAGKFDEMLGELDDLSHLSKEEFESRVGIDPNINNKIPTQYATTLKQEATKLKDLHDNIDLRFDHISMGAREQLFDYASNMEHSNKRMDDMFKDFQETPELLMAIKNYQSDKTAGNKVILEEAKKNAVDKFNEKGTDMVSTVDDYIKLLDRRKEFADKYKEYSTIQGIEKLEDKVKYHEKKAEDNARQAEASKFQGRGQRIVNKGTEEVVGKLYKIGKGTKSEYRLYNNLQEFEGQLRPKGKYEVVDPSSQDFIDKYDVHPEDINKEGRDLDTKQSKRLLDKLASIKDPDEFVDYIENEVKPLKLSNEDLVLESARELWWKLTQEKLKKGELFEKKTKVYRNNTTGVQSEVTNLPNGNYLVKEKGSKKSTELTREELDAKYEYVTLKQEKWAKFKQSSIETLERLIASKEALLAESKQKFAETEPLFFLKKQLDDLQKALSTHDGRRTETSKKSLVDAIEKLQKEVSEREELIQKMIEEQEKLQVHLNYLYGRLQDEQNTFDVTDLKELTKNVEESIKENDGIIGEWKKRLVALKNLLNKLIRMFGLGSIYQEKWLDPRVHGKERKEIQSKIDNLGSAQRQFVPTLSKIREAQTQIDLFEKTNNDLYKKLEFIEEERNSLKNIVKTKEMTVPAKPRTDIKSSKSTKKTGTLTSPTDHNNDTTDTDIPAEDTESTISKVYKSARRALINVYTGLAGKHREQVEGDPLVENANARRYYRFTGRNKLTDGQFYVTLSKGDRFEQYANEADKTVIVATVINKNGDKVDEFGKVTTDPNKFVFTNLPVSETSIQTYEGDNLKGKEKEDFDIKLSQLKAEHLERRKNILTKLDKGEEVKYQVIGKGIGVPRYNSEEYSDKNRIKVNDVGIKPENLHIRVATDVNTTFESGNTVTTKPGFIYAEDLENRNVIPIQPRKMETADIDMVVNLFRYFIKKHNTSSKGLSGVGAGTLQTINKKGEAIAHPYTIFDILPLITFWTGNNLNVDAAKKVKNNALTLDNALKDEKNLINKDPNKSFHFIQSKVPGGEIALGTNRVQLFVKDSTGKYVENPALEGEIRNFLADKYVHVSAITLNDNRGVIDIKNIDTDKLSVDIDDTTYSADNKGYKGYLLDKGILETPVIAKGTEVNGEEIPQFSSQYAILDYAEDKQSAAKPKEASLSSEDILGTTNTLPSENIVGNVSDDLFENADENIDNFRTATEEFEGATNINEAKKNIEEMFNGKVAFEVVDRLINNKYWGKYRNALITIYEGAEVGTEFHEAFHAVRDMFLNKVETNSLFNEWRRLNNKLDYTDKQVEEELAEDFRDFMLGKDIKYFPRKQRNFFQKVLDFIKGIVFSKEANIQNVFDKIRKGYYGSKEFSTSDNISKFSSVVKGLSVQQTKDILDGVNSFFFKEVFANPDSVASLFTKDDNVQMVANAYTVALAKINGVAKRLIKQREEATTPEEKQIIQDKINVLGMAVKNWGEVKTLHRDYLNRYKLEISEDEDWIEKRDENNQVKDSGSIVPTESLKFSTKLNASKSIKLLIGTLPVVTFGKDKDGNITHQGVANSLGLPYNVDFGKIFATLSNYLADKTSWEDMSDTLDELSTEIPALSLLKSRLGGNKTWEGLESSEIQARIQFIQTFAKSSNTYVMDIVGPNGIIQTINANINSYEKRRVETWKKNAYTHKNLNYYKLVDNKLTYNTDIFKKLDNVKDVEGAKRVLKLLGIEFSNPERVTTPELVNKTNALLNTIRKGNGESIFSKEGNSYGNVKYFLDLESSTSVNNVENSLINLNGETVYGETLNNYISLILNGINSKGITTKEELFQAFPHLEFIENSLVLDRLFDSKGNKTDIASDIHMGSKEEDSGDVKEFKNLKPADQLQTRFNRGVQGIYNLLRPADNSIERFVTFGTFFNENAIAQDKHIDAFLGYLQSEINFGRESLTSQWSNLKGNATRGIVLDAIKEIEGENSKLYKELVELITDTNDGVDNYFSKPENREVIGSTISDYIDKQVNKNKSLLLENKLVVENGENFNNNGIFYKNGKKVISKAEFNGIVNLYTINSLVANIEQVKLFMNSPQYFKSVEDQFKRHSGYVGTKKISITDKFLNNWIDTYFDKFSKFKQQYMGTEPIIRTAIMNDVKVISEYFNDYKQLLGEEVSKDYGKINEADAQGYIHLSEYRRFLLRSGDWTFGKNSLEEAYQYEMGNRTYTDPKTGETWKIDPNGIDKVVFNPLKPQYFGPIAEEGVFVPGFYKLSLIPLIPSLVIKNNLSKMNTQMEEQKTGIVTFISGNKVGTKLNDKGEVQELYKGGEFAFDKTTLMTTQDTYYKYWGIQVDMGNKSKNQVVTGTQMMKHIFNGLFSQGSAKLMRFYDYTGKLTTKSTEEVFQKYKELNEERLKLGLSELVESLGLTKVGDNYAVKDASVFIDKLRKEAIARNMPDNIVNGLEFIRDKGIDVLPNREKIENILFSLADATSISIKRFGKASVQVANTLTETSKRQTTTTKDGRTFYTSNDLKFYGLEFDKNGDISKVKSMEVYLPEMYRGLVEVDKINKLDPRLLKILGFRIPTQGLNSIESIVVKGFISKSAGDIIIVPSELVAKAGSDFDIDKLNLYLPNFYRNTKGLPVYITNSKTAWEKYQLDNVVEGAEDKLLTWEQWSRKGIENDLTELMHEIVTSPDNAKQLLTPNSAAGLKNEADYIMWLKGDRKSTFEEYKSSKRVEEKSTPYNKMIETSYLLNASDKFLGANTAVGITALYSAFSTIAQTSEVFVKDSETTQLNLPHNTTGFTNDIGLGNLESFHEQGGEFENIPQSLSEWINAAVDAAKDPFMFDMNANTQTLNTVLYLTMAGVPRRTITLFMNQPIILDYIANQNKYESMIAEENNFSLYKSEIRAITEAKYGITYTKSRRGNIIRGEYKNPNNSLDNELLEEQITKKVSNATQLQVLDDFIRYQETTKYLGDAIKGSQFDTKAGGKNVSEMLYSLTAANRVLTDDVIGNFDKVLDNSFISPYYKNVKEFREMFAPYVLSLKYKNASNIMDKMVEFYFNPEINIPKDRVIKVLDRFKQDFITYLLMSTPRENTLTLASEIDRLFKGDSSMASQVAQMQVKYPNNMLLDALFPIFGDKINNVKLFTTKIDSLESNRLTEDWEELFNSGNEKFANDLIDFIILQSGLQNSPINFIHLVPTQQYAKLVDRIIERLGKEEDSFDDYYKEFPFMNSDNTDIMPKKPTQGFPYSKKVERIANPDGSYSYSEPKFYETVERENKLIRGAEIKLNRPGIKNYAKNSTMNTYSILGSNSVKNMEENLENPEIESTFTEKGKLTLNPEDLILPKEEEIEELMKKCKFKSK